MSTRQDHKQRGRALCRAAAVVLGIACLGSAGAQESPGNVTSQQLRDALAERDAVIIDLLDRVRALEARLAAAGDDDPSRETAGPLGPPEGRLAEAAASREADFAVDALTAERALERGLVQEGVRLLGPGEIELVPEVALSRQVGMFPTALMTGDADVVGEIERAFDVYERNAGLRIGLPLTAQLEIGIPYRTVDLKTETGVDGAVQSVIGQEGSGFGDVTLGIAKELVGEASWRPNLIGRLVWLSGSGEERDGSVFLGGGTRGVAARLSASWRRDPVVFLVDGGYTYYDRDAALRPGDSLDLSLGLGLAVSPETALIFSLDQSVAEEFERDGVSVPGTDRLASSLGLSASTIIGRRLFLRVNAGAGLTDDAPDYRFGVSLSSRFDMQ